MISFRIGTHSIVIKPTNVTGLLIDRTESWTGVLLFKNYKQKSGLGVWMHVYTYALRTHKPVELVGHHNPPVHVKVP